MAATHSRAADAAAAAAADDEIHVLALPCHQGAPLTAAAASDGEADSAVDLYFRGLTGGGTADGLPDSASYSALFTAYADLKSKYNRLLRRTARGQHSYEEGRGEGRGEGRSEGRGEELSEPAADSMARNDCVGLDGERRADWPILLQSNRTWLKGRSSPV